MFSFNSTVLKISLITLLSLNTKNLNNQNNLINKYVCGENTGYKVLNKNTIQCYTKRGYKTKQINF